MKLAFAVLLLFAIVPIDANANESARLEVKVAGQPVSLDSSKDLAVKFWLQQLVLSALYSNVVQESTVSEWATALQGDATIHCRYPVNSLLAIPERRTLTFDEVLLPVPVRGWPAYVYLKHGSTYTRVAKYDPWVLAKLKVESGISTTLEPTISRRLF